MEADRKMLSRYTQSRGDSLCRTAPPARLIPAGALTLIVLLLAGEARADNLGALAFVVIIWPLGLLCILLLFVLGIVGLVKLRARVRARAFATALLVISIGVAVLYPLTCLLLSGAYDSRAPVDVMVLTIVPVELFAVGTIALAAVLRRRAG
jgi:hypothetical protein